MYSYEIVNAIAEATNNQVKMPIGTLHPSLRQLEGKGFVESSWGDDNTVGARRRYYTRSAVGGEALEEKKSVRRMLEAHDSAVVFEDF